MLNCVHLEMSYARISGSSSYRVVFKGKRHCAVEQHRIDLMNSASQQLVMSKWDVMASSCLLSARKKLEQGLCNI